jgi:hypothetical protein
MNRFWLALEQFWGLSTSRLSWQLHLDDAEITRYELLVATNQLATILPVVGNSHEWLEVSEFEEGVFEGYNEKTEEYVPVDRRDLVCYELHVGILGRILGELIGFAPNVNLLANSQHCFSLGQLGSTASAGFAFYFAKVSDPRRLRDCLDTIQLRDVRPYVLFVTSARMLSSECTRTLNDKGCLVLPLEQALVGEENDWILSGWAQMQLVDFRDRQMPKPQSATGTFPTPAHCTWRDVEIRFQDSHTVTVIAGGQHARLMYNQMGLANGKNGLPNMQWELLFTLAQNHGVMTWKSPGARRENRKHRESLNRRLREFFGIEGDPIELTEDKKGYRCEFRIQPDCDR